MSEVIHANHLLKQVWTWESDLNGPLRIHIVREWERDKCVWVNV